MISPTLDLSAEQQSETMHPRNPPSRGSQSAMGDVAVLEKFVEAVGWSIPFFESLGKVRPDWDGENSLLPSSKLVSFGAGIVALLKMEHPLLPPTEVAPVRDGGISCEWDADSRSLIVEIAPSGELQFLFKDRSKNVRKSGQAIHNRSFSNEFLLAADLMFR